MKINNPQYTSTFKNFTKVVRVGQMAKPAFPLPVSANDKF